ncbi:four-helix bundle copper-binding protein [Alicyclobacillus dauci]|uniref:Four-helix bundle copper-binding protein n=1 Tax=Alicyclobacillus dauci TaxID=1475485 RepID=A0ABY6Z7N1_9BACL|nr:four-helix bundle copper-binding protein [Alicyclobacillus dauci]WAH38698.1 four-helix bundle copper-binding protein [Alicyclobacillus dauci]
MPSEYNTESNFDEEYRSEKKPLKAQKKYEPPKKYELEKHEFEHESPSLPEMPKYEHESPSLPEMPTFKMPEFESPVVQYVKKVQPMPKPKPQPQQYMYMQYEIEEEKIEIDPSLFAVHPMHHCPTICEYIKDCMLTCERTMHILMCQPDVHLRMRKIAMLQDCAEVCFLTTRQVARRSPMLRMSLRYCAKVCRTCGHECMRYPDPESQACSRMCLHAADVCEKFVNQQKWS